VHALAIATGTSDNAAHGYNWTFAFPMILFIVIVGALLVIYSRPHKVPGHGRLRFAETKATEAGSVPEPETARAAAVAAGFTTAAGGGAAESVAEPAGAHRAASLDDESGNVSRDEDPAAADGPVSGQPPSADERSSADEPSTPDEPSTEDREAGE
jgi:hypothetical protein